MYHSRKKGFTMVELVIVIAVIAILAAILIPTFTNLIRKANEASALANARNAANQLLANLLARGDDAKDLVIFNQKGDDIYVYGYSAEAGRVLTYYGNPVDAKSIDGETLEDKAGKLLEKMLANGELTYYIPRPVETDWWHPSKMEEVVIGLNFKPEEMVLRADYKIVLARFEKGGQPEHTCTAADLDKIDEVKPTCMTQGYPAYWVCRVCGKAYHDANATQPVSAENPLVATPIARDAHQLGAWQYDENKHWQVCALNPEHTHLNEAAHTGNPCTVCGYSTGGNTPTSPAGKKNGLVDGYYYKDDELFTGTEDGYTFRDGCLVISLASPKVYKQANGSSVVDSRTYNYTIPNASQYLTDKIFIDGDNCAYADSATINIKDESGNNYTVKSVKAVAPFSGLLDKTGWTSADITAYLMNAGGRSLISNGYILDSTLSNKLTSYAPGSYDDPDAYDLFIPKLCADSELVKAYLSLNGCSSVADYYKAYQNDTLVIGFADYLRLIYGKGYALTKENGTIKYNKSYGERYQSGLAGSFYITVSPNESTGYPEISFVSKNNGSYMTAPTTTDGNGNLVFCSYVIDADGSTHCTDGNYLSMLKFFTGNDYYVSITDSRVVMRKGSLSGQEYCRFEIDNTNHVIKTYMNGTITDANGLPFTLPSSGTVTLENGKISLTGAFDVSNTTVSASDLSGLKGSSNSSYIMFDTELIELVVKAAYKGTIRVACGGSTYGVGETIPGSVFTKSGDGVLSATFEEGFAPRDIYTLLMANIFNGIDYAGPTFEIVLERNN